MGIMPALADAQAVALATGRAPSTIRKWAMRGWLARKGTDARGRVLYDVTEARKLAERLDAQLSQAQLDNHAHQQEH